jgi:hypothetical protein
MWTKDAIASRIDELAADQHGPALVEAIERFSRGLDEGARELLGEVLLERADTEHALRERIDTRGWLRRQWDRAGGGQR